MHLWILVAGGLMGVVAVSRFVGVCYAPVGHNRRRAELRRALTTVREYEFIPVQVESLARATQERFERHTPALLELGYAPLGDFRLKPRPVEVHNRFFLSPEGDMLASVSSLLDTGGVSFISVLADGTCVHTSSSKNPRPDRTIEAEDQMLLTYADNNDVVELHRLHQTISDDAAQGRAAAPLCFSDDQLRALIVYDQRLFNRWRYRHGDFTTHPPAAEFATLQSVACI